MKHLKILISLIATQTFTVQAGSVTTKLPRVGAATETYAIVFTESTPNNIPNCATSYPKELSFDKTTEHGKAMLSIALSAYMANKNIYIQVNDNTCGLWGSRALVTRIDVVN